MKLKIIPNPKKKWALELASELSTYLARDHEIIKKKAEVTICIGGDGTILYANHKKRLEGTILGIGGDKSYICQLHNNNWQDKIHSVLSSDKQNIMSLECSIGSKKFIALNDIVIHATHYRVAEMDLLFGKKKISFEGDGMIVSSPLGSTGYAFSAGGDKLKPAERMISLVPICPYRRAFSPKLLSENETIDIAVGNDCAFITDGIFVRRLKKGETVTVKKGPDMIFFSGVGTWE